jgi:hypothetical protein
MILRMNILYRILSATENQNADDASGDPCIFLSSSVANLQTIVQRTALFPENTEFMVESCNDKNFVDKVSCRQSICRQKAVDETSVDQPSCRKLLCNSYKRNLG